MSERSERSNKQCVITWWSQVTKSSDANCWCCHVNKSSELTFNSQSFHSWLWKSAKIGDVKLTPSKKVLFQIVNRVAFATYANKIKRVRIAVFVHVTEFHVFYRWKLDVTMYFWWSFVMNCRQKLVRTCEFSLIKSEKTSLKSYGKTLILEEKKSKINRDRYA